MYLKCTPTMTMSPRSKYCSLIQQTFGILKKRYHVLYGLRTTTDRPCTARWVVTECVILRIFGIQLVKFSKQGSTLTFKRTRPVGPVAANFNRPDLNITRPDYGLPKY